MTHTDMTFWLLLGAVIGTIVRLLLFVLAGVALDQIFRHITKRKEK